MNGDALDRALNQVLRQGEEYGGLASFVSDQIGEVEYQLNEMAGKIQFTFVKDKVALNFVKLQGAWGLWVIDPYEGSMDPFLLASRDDWERLVDSTVVTKARALAMLPEMLERMAAEQAQRITQLKDAIGDNRKQVGRKGGR